MVEVASVADKLLYSVRILLESVIRKCDYFQVTNVAVQKIINWGKLLQSLLEFPSILLMFSCRILHVCQLLSILLVCVMQRISLAVTQTKLSLWYLTFSLCSIN